MTDYKQYTEEDMLAITKTWGLYIEYRYDPYQNNVLPNNILENYKIL